jgi:signal transduction histidine kinase
MHEPALPDLRAPRDTDRRLKADVRDAEVALLTNVVARISDGILVESDTGHVVVTNPRFRELFNLQTGPRDLTGAPVAAINDALRRFAARFEAARSIRSPFAGATMETADGRTIEVHYVPLVQTGMPGLHLWQCRDITARTLADAELKSSRQRLDDSAAHQETVRDDDRRRIGHILHDDLGQLLTAIKLELAPAMQFFQTARTPHAAHVVDRLQVVSGLLDLSITAVRRISSELRPAAFGVPNLAAALHDEAMLFASRTGIRCRATVAPPRLTIDPARTGALHAILMEALTNIARHSGAGTAYISLRKVRGVLWLRVRDNGRGPGTSRAGAIQALGLLGMREKALALGGDVRITPGSRCGTVVTARLPLSQPRRAKKVGGTGA